MSVELDNWFCPLLTVVLKLNFVLKLKTSCLFLGIQRKKDGFCHLKDNTRVSVCQVCSIEKTFWQNLGAEPGTSGASGFYFIWGAV